MIVRYLCIIGALVCGLTQGFSAELIPQSSQWRYMKGLSEASAPNTVWRTVDFSDAGWEAGPAPIYYGEPLTGTLLGDMQGLYSSVFMRKTFTVSNPALVGELVLETLSDDGFIAWINGVEVARYNTPAGDLPFNGTSFGPLTEPIPWETTVLTGAQGYLVPGVNVLAVHGFNANLASSSDFVFDAKLSSITDVSAPVVESTVPADRALVRSLNTIEVIFSETVTGVDAADLLINGVPATDMTSPGPRQFLFTFSEPPTGTV